MGRKLGQHFLRDDAVADAILAAAAPAPGEPMLEIGPGGGILTGRLLKRGVRLSAVELDPALAKGLAARWGGHPGFRLIEGDILKVDLAPSALFGGGQPYAVIANLPYYLSTPLLFRLAACRAHFSRLTLMVQREVAARITAAPAAGKAYGSLSIAAQHAFTARLLMRVPPSAFRPPPRVDSALIGLTPRTPVLKREQEERFFQHVKRLFTRRRKLMASGFRTAAERLPPERWETVARLTEGRRADALTPQEHLAVFRALYPCERPAR